MANQIAFYPQSSGSGGLTVIQSQTVAGTPTSVVFSAIPQTYKNLTLVGTFAENGGGSNLVMQLNGDTAAHYNSINTFGSGSAASGNTSTGVTSAVVAIGTAGAIEINIPNYRVTALGIVYFTAQGAGNAGSTTGNWAGTDVTSITLFDSAGATFLAGSTFTLYGY